VNVVVPQSTAVGVANVAHVNVGSTTAIVSPTARGAFNENVNLTDDNDDVMGFATSSLL
jgi:hypothetical protein